LSEEARALLAGMIGGRIAKERRKYIKRGRNE
jgi:hypothetical protein